MYSGIYISLNLQFVLSTRKEAQISITQLKEERYTVGKILWRGGTYVTQISISQSILLINSSAPEGGIDELWEIWKVCMPRRYLHPSQTFWLLVPIGQNRRLKVRWARKRKPERGYALRLDSHISQLIPAINSSNRRRESGKKRDASWKNLKWGLYPQISISFNYCD